jgi:hypothetical protein
MARRTQTYAIRLAVEGGGQVKAELVSVGQSGEQSLKRIESAGERASGGFKGLGRQAELLRTGIRTLGDALIGVTTVGGLGALIDRSISAADGVGKTADKIGVGVEVLQELRFDGASWVNEDSPYDVGMFIPGRRATARSWPRWCSVAVSLADDFASARAHAGVSATAATVLDVHRNGSPIGTITFGIGASTASFATAGAGAETFAVGEQRHCHHHVLRRDRERYHLVDDRRDIATRTPRTVRGRLLPCLQYRGGDQHQRPVRHLPLGLGLLDIAGLQRRHCADRVLRRILDPRHGAALARRSVRLSAPMERAAGALWQRATRHASLDRHRRGHLPHGVACRNRPTSRDVHGRMVVCYSSLP